MSEVAEVLRKALTVFGADGENWTQGPSEHKECAVTALDLVNGYMGPPYVILCRVAGVREGCLSLWNDAKGRTFAEVKAAFEQAIEQAEANHA